MVIAINHRMLLNTILVICVFFGYDVLFCQSFNQVNDKKQLEKKVDEYVRPYLETADFSGSILIAKSGEAMHFFLSERMRNRLNRA